MSVPLIDLTEQHAALRSELSAAFDRVLATSGFVGGPEVQGFESEFASYCEVEHAVGVANGTDALALALRALDIGPGVAVAVPSFTFAATAEAVCHVGARPLFVDIDPTTFTMDPGALRRAIAASSLPVRAVIPVHLYGQCADMDEIDAIAAEHELAVVEDAAQAHGARYRGRRAGSLGTVACFSFYPTKNLGALGDGGALTCHDAALAARLRELRDHGQREKYLHATVGFNSRLDALQAAALRIKLRHLDTWNDRRRAAAQLYDQCFADLAGIRAPVTAAGREHVYHLYVIRSAARDDLRHYLQERGIGSAIHYPVALHQQKAFRFAADGTLPVAEQATREVLALPMYPEIGPAAVQAVCETVAAWAHHQGAQR